MLFPQFGEVFCTQEEGIFSEKKQEFASSLSKSVPLLVQEKKFHQALQRSYLPVFSVVFSFFALFFASWPFVPMGRLLGWGGAMLLASSVLFFQSRHTLISGTEKQKRVGFLCFLVLFGIGLAIFPLLFSAFLSQPLLAFLIPFFCLMFCLVWLLENHRLLAVLVACGGSGQLVFWLSSPPLSEKGPLFFVLFSCFALLVFVSYLFERLFEEGIYQKIRYDRSALLLDRFFYDCETLFKGGVWETDSFLRLKRFSPGFQALIGKPVTLGFSLEKNLGILSSSKELEKLKREWENRQNFSLMGVPVSCLRKANGLVRVIGYPLFGPEGEFLGYKGVVAEEESKDSSASSAEEHHASEVKGHFLSLVSHELRTPLNAMVGFSELLLSSDPAHVKTRDHQLYIESILQAARTLLGTLNDMIELSSFAEGKLVLSELHFDPLELLDSALKKSHAEIARKKIELRVTSSLPTLEIWGDWKRLLQVVSHLLVNSVKFNRVGGDVLVNLSLSSEGDFSLSIQDTGVGIACDQIESAFQSFHQVEKGYGRRFSGAGLGLSVARNVARAHGGDIVIESNVGVGTTVYLTLPRYRVKVLQFPKEQPAA